MIWFAVFGWLAAGSLALLVLTARRRLEDVRRAEHEIRGPLTALGLAAEQVRRGRAGRELAGMLEAQLDRARAGLGDLTAALGGARGSGGSGRCTDRPVGVPLEGLARSTADGWAGVAARGGGSLRFDWRAGPVTVAADRGRLAQALGNLLANAIEHGGGEVELRGELTGGAVRVEIADSGAANRGPWNVSGKLAIPPPASSDACAPLPQRGRGLAIASRAVEESGGRLEIHTTPAGTTAAVELPVEER